MIDFKCIYFPLVSLLSLPLKAFTISFKFDDLWLEKKKELLKFLSFIYLLLVNRELHWQLFHVSLCNTV